jgi:hypothetical protein
MFSFDGNGQGFKNKVLINKIHVAVMDDIAG